MGLLETRASETGKALVDPDRALAVQRELEHFKAPIAAAVRDDYRSALYGLS